MEDNVTYRCNSCLETFLEQSELQEHVCLISSENISLCIDRGEALSAEDELKEQHKTDIKKKRAYDCEICQKGFPTLGGLKAHMVTHTDQKPFVCGECQRGFSHMGLLKRHMIVHTKEKRFVCEVCQQRFSAKASLQCHMFLHTGKKSFSCEICEKKFYTKKALGSHIRTHTASKPEPLVCEICHKSIHSRANFLLHIRSVHSGEKPFVCDVCDVRFSVKNGLMRHLRRYHTNEKPYACETCQKSFFDKESVRYHRLIHSGKKSFSCEVCEKSFYTKSDLNTHIRRHNRVKTSASQEILDSEQGSLESVGTVLIKPFKCDICAERFSKINFLTRHLRKYHSNDSSFACDACKKAFPDEGSLICHKVFHEQPPILVSWPDIEEIATEVKPSVAEVPLH